ncbi:hypothetical protein EC912_103153 [Luteibacter rhizovicinus]|uniref:Parallel beta helix pectate lyase-like protein n=1 Tax=Luteibacter rhizovicinus TaxID=242606 RepID=A0A4R3YSI8_9GAMM|nr:DUF6519 domain-containing protein [Luteibacter rhizovicinus]TCV94668.1 hypothetical protein EC912_103153 [Luteibacter rhizovicinus]
MSGDYSRYTFDPTRNFFGVFLEQGRPLLDQDWNEWVAQVKRQAQATALDTFGGDAVVPATTPDAFAIAIAGTGLTIGPGRIYVDGLLAENHGVAPDTWDAQLAESRGSSATPFDKQPWLPAPVVPDLSKPGIFLAYVDVWEREVTSMRLTALVEKAVGFGTSTRAQTVWQVKTLEIKGAASGSVACDTNLADWNALIAPSAGRLSTHVAAFGSDDPCIIPPEGGYKSPDNHLYRAEIHKSGPPGVATFKFSRENASIEAHVLSFTNNASFVVDTVGKDDKLGFQPGDWIELTDDRHELNQLPGMLLRIATGGVDSVARSITVEQAITGPDFTVPGTPDPLNGTRIRRWDQKGQVFQTDVAPIKVYTDLSAAGADGSIVVPASATSVIALENGIAVSFDVVAAGGTFHTGDYWLFAARSVDASVELLTDAPPLGIHHHYARLGVVTTPNTVSDCRKPWPPAQSTGGDGCACTICISPDDFKKDNGVLQKAVDVVARTGGTVCLEAGEYRLAEPVKVANQASLTLRGQGTATRVVALGGSAFLVDAQADVAIEAMAIVIERQENAAGIVLLSTADVILTVEQVDISTQALEGNAATNPSVVAIGVLKQIGRLRLESNTFRTPNGLVSLSAEVPRDGTANPVDMRELYATGNTFTCVLTAVNVQIKSDNSSVVRIEGNAAGQCSDTAYAIANVGAGDTALHFSGNRLLVFGNGVVSNAATAAIVDNDFEQIRVIRDQGHGCAIMLGDDSGKTGTPRHAQVVDNRIENFRDGAIQAGYLFASLMVRGNRIDGCGAGVVVIMDTMADDGQCTVDVTGNVILADKDVDLGDRFFLGIAIARIAKSRAKLTDVDLLMMKSAAAIAATKAKKLTPETIDAGSRIEVTGNQIAARVRAVAVIVSAPGFCNVSNNHCTVVRTDSTPAVIANATSVVVGGNQVQGQDPAISIIAGTLGDRGPAATILGNITQGDILLNAAPPGAPWKDLNIRQ